MTHAEHRRRIQLGAPFGIDTANSQRAPSPGGHPKSPRLLPHFEERTSARASEPRALGNGDASGASRACGCHVPGWRRDSANWTSRRCRPVGLDHLNNDPVAFARLLSRCRRHDWNVYAKPPFGGPEQALKYLARYTHRIAISTTACSRLTPSRSPFHGKTTPMAINDSTPWSSSGAFSSSLPGHFVRIRSYGFLANCSRSTALDRCRTLLESRPHDRRVPDDSASGDADDPHADAAESTSVSCPRCSTGTLHRCRSSSTIRPDPARRSIRQPVSSPRSWRSHRASSAARRTPSRPHPAHSTLIPSASTQLFAQPRPAIAALVSLDSRSKAYQIP
jgi:hypothetical protein